MQKSIIVFCTGLVLAVLVHKSFSIHCWECRSEVDSKCVDPFNNQSVQLSDCSMLMYYDYQGNLVDPNTCLKIVHEKYGKTVTIRRCAYLNESGNHPDQQNTCVDQLGINTVALYSCRPNECEEDYYCPSCTTRFCACQDKDGCNASSHLRVSMYINILMLFIVLSCFMKNIT